MTTANLPVDELRERAESRRFRPGYALAAVTYALLAALGWITGRGLVVLGWIAGRTWLSLAYMAEAVIFGFRNGAGLPPKAAPDSGKPPAGQ